MIELTLPSTFWRDHFDRCSEHPGLRVVVKSTGSRVTVHLDREALGNLKSDADHYANDGADAPRGLCISAAATLRAIVNQMIDQRKDI